MQQARFLFDDVPNLMATMIEKMERLEYLVSNSNSQQPPQNAFERLTRQDIADQYRVSLGTIHNAMKSRKLPFEKVGRKTIFKRTDVEAWTGNKKGGEKC